VEETIRKFSNFSCIGECLLVKLFPNKIVIQGYVILALNLQPPLHNLPCLSGTSNSCL